MQEHDFKTVNPIYRLHPQNSSPPNFEIYFYYIVLCCPRDQFVHVNANCDDRSLIAEYCNCSDDLRMQSSTRIGSNHVGLPLGWVGSGI